MNPVIVIPSYWALTDRIGDVGEIGTYDHVTPVDKPVPELELCLSSLDSVRGVLRVVILLVAPKECEDSARARVEGICRTHPALNPLIVGSGEARVIARAVARVAPTMPDAAVSLRGYGAIRNMGLAIAAVLGHDIVVFLDDDEVCLDENFLIQAVYGLGLKNRQGLPISAKSGYFLNRQDSPYSDVEKPSWRDAPWSKRDDFNELMERMQSGTRISRATYVCGGCFALTADVFCKVGFDSTITRGEDLDYLLNLRMNGYDMWFDNEWCVRHMPPDMPSRAARFLQDVYRWTYERKKLEVTNNTIGLRKISAESLEPYPSAWVSDEVEKKIKSTALRRAIAGPERKAYLNILTKGINEANAWADSVSTRYLEFQTYWPRVMDALWDNRTLARMVSETGTARLGLTTPSYGPRSILGTEPPLDEPSEAS